MTSRHTLPPVVAATWSRDRRTTPRNTSRRREQRPREPVSAARCSTECNGVVDRPLPVRLGHQRSAARRLRAPVRVRRGVRRTSSRRTWRSWSIPSEEPVDVASGRGDLVAEHARSLRGGAAACAKRSSAHGVAGAGAAVHRYADRSRHGAATRFILRDRRSALRCRPRGARTGPRFTWPALRIRARRFRHSRIGPARGRPRNSWGPGPCSACSKRRCRSASRTSRRADVQHTAATRSAASSRRRPSSIRSHSRDWQQLPLRLLTGAAHAAPLLALMTAWT